MFEQVNKETEGKTKPLERILQIIIPLLEANSATADAKYKATSHCIARRHFHNSENAQGTR